MDVRESIGTELARTSRSWRAALDERLRGTGLTQARWTTLLFLFRSGGGLTQRALAELVGVEGPTLGRCLDALEEQGLIARRPAEGDRRAKEVHLTELAGPVLDKIDRIALALRREVLAELPADDLRTCLRVMLHIQDRLKKAPVESGEPEDTAS